MGNQANKEKDKDKDINGINIPKGAVANGRAKFESQKISPEKPLRFFGSRSRPSTPLLPVKAPKVPAPADPSGGTPGPVKKKSNSIPSAVVTSPEISPTPKNENLMRKVKRFVLWEEMWQEYQFLVFFFKFFNMDERVTLAQVSNESMQRICMNFKTKRTRHEEIILIIAENITKFNN